MTEFDQIKALKEEIGGMVDVLSTLTRRERQLNAEFTELEVELNTVTKLRGFAQAELERKREVLKKLSEEK